MIKRSTSSLLILVTTLFTLQNCASSKVPTSQGGFYHSDIYFGKHFPEHYKEGIIDGCSTAKGNYAKSHKQFNNSSDYNNGWFLGRRRCRHLLIVEENKEDK